MIICLVCEHMMQHRCDQIGEATVNNTNSIQNELEYDTKHVVELWHHGGSIKSLPNTSRTSRYYGTEGSEGVPELDSHIPQRREIFRLLMKSTPNYQSNQPDIRLYLPFSD